MNPAEWRIYAPRERVRAQQTSDGSHWLVYDGTEFHTFTDKQFKETYEPCAQHAVLSAGKRQEFHLGRT